MTPPPSKSILPAVAILLTLTIISIPSSAATIENNGAAASASAYSASAPTDIVIGFVGGFVRRDDLRHGPVKLAHRLRELYPGKVNIATFENRHWKDAYRSIIRLLDADHNGVLSDDERKNARIVLFGHSWGASAVIALARNLRRENIPVLLTVQVDSVAKPGDNDSIIPANVAQAANFFQPSGLIHGRQKISAADPAHTEILGNYRFDYRRQPVACLDNSPWLMSHLERTHLESECDPRIWSQVETLIRSRLSPAVNSSEVGFLASPIASTLK